MKRVFNYGDFKKIYIFQIGKNRQKKRVEKSEKLKKKFFSEKPENTWFLFKKKFNWGSDITFQVLSWYGMHGAWPKKMPKVHNQKSFFHLQHPDAPRLDFESLKILQRTYFCAFCTILRSNGHYLPKIEKKFQDVFYQKNTLSTFRVQ